MNKKFLVMVLLGTCSVSQAFAGARNIYEDKDPKLTIPQKIAKLKQMQDEERVVTNIWQRQLDKLYFSKSDEHFRNKTEVLKISLEDRLNKRQMKSEFFINFLEAQDKTIDTNKSLTIAQGILKAIPQNIQKLKKEELNLIEAKNQIKEESDQEAQSLNEKIKKVTEEKERHTQNQVVFKMKELELQQELAKINKEGPYHDKWKGLQGTYTYYLRLAEKSPNDDVSHRMAFEYANSKRNFYKELVQFISPEKAFFNDPMDPNLAAALRKYVHETALNTLCNNNIYLGDAKRPQLTAILPIHTFDFNKVFKDTFGGTLNLLTFAQKQEKKWTERVLKYVEETNDNSLKFSLYRELHDDVKKPANQK